MPSRRLEASAAGASHFRTQRLISPGRWRKPDNTGHPRRRADPLGQAHRPGWAMYICGGSTLEPRECLNHAVVFTAFPLGPDRNWCAQSGGPCRRSRGEDYEPLKRLPAVWKQRMPKTRNLVGLAHRGADARPGFGPGPIPPYRACAWNDSRAGSVAPYAGKRVRNMTEVDLADWGARRRRRFAPDRWGTLGVPPRSGRKSGTCAVFFLTPSGRQPDRTRLPVSFMTFFALIRQRSNRAGAYHRLGPAARDGG